MKGADKGPAVVVWDREDYIKKRRDHLGLVMSMKKSQMILNQLLAPYMQH